MNFSDKGSPSLLILSVPGEFTHGGSHLECFCTPVLSRDGGMLLNVPRSVFNEDVLIDSLQVAEPDALIGPSKGITSKLCCEDDDGEIVVRNIPTNSLVIDFSDAVLEWLREYDPSADADASPLPFSEELPAGLPVASEILMHSRAWIEQLGSERVFYSAQEDPDLPPSPKPSAKTAAAKKAPNPKRVTNNQVMDQLTLLVAQVKSLAARQDALEMASAVAAPAPSVGVTVAVPPVSAGLQDGPTPGVAFAKYAKLVGPPPKVRAPVNLVPPLGGETSVAAPAETHLEEPPDLMHAISQQSSAVLALVSHLAGQQDPLVDLQSPGLLSTSTKGVQRREKMQMDLATGSSTYYVQMMQQLHKKLYPSRPLPRSEDEMSHLSFLDYLEKTGGFKNARESGLVLWLVGHAIDAAAVEDMHMVKERLALLAISLEQSVVDRGDWSIAYLLSLAADPPLAMFQDRTNVVSPFSHPFSQLVPPSWSAAVLSYVKELEVLTNKKPESTSPKKQPKSPSENPSPKKKQPRFPKVPKGAASGSQE